MTIANYLTSIMQDDGTLPSAELIKAYEAGIDRLRGAVSRMTTEQVLARPIPGQWSTQEVVCHIADTEIFFADRIERTIALERPLLIGIDERPYPQRLRYQDLDLEEELNLVTALRRHVARILRLQPDEAWERTAVHSETGLVTLRQLLFHAIRHLQHHAAFIDGKRKAILEASQSNT